jgi:dihydroorotase-like cyclic amidohydrolase
MATLIKGGRIVTSEGEYQGDILLEGAKVATIGRDPARQLIVDGDRWLGREGMGEFLKRGESGRL